MGYVDEVLAKVKEKNASEPEFLQAVEEVLESLRPVIEANEELYKKNAILERITEPDQCHWTIQGRIKTSSFCKLKHHQILRI